MILARSTKRLTQFTGLAYTGAVLPLDFGRKVILDLDGIRPRGQQLPMFRQHDHLKIPGHTKSVRVDEKGIKIAGVFSGLERHANEIIIPARNGFEWELSIDGAAIDHTFLDHGDMEKVNGRLVRGPITVVHTFDLVAVSFVTLGADGDTWVRIV